MQRDRHLRQFLAMEVGFYSREILGEKWARVTNSAKFLIGVQGRWQDVFCDLRLINIKHPWPRIVFSGMAHYPFWILWCLLKLCVIHVWIFPIHCNACCLRGSDATRWRHRMTKIWRVCVYGNNMIFADISDMNIYMRHERYVLWLPYVVPR